MKPLLAIIQSHETRYRFKLLDNSLVMATAQLGTKKKAEGGNIGIVGTDDWAELNYVCRELTKLVEINLRQC